MNTQTLHSKKEYFILKDAHNIGKSMRAGTVFVGCFWNEGVAHSELKMGLQIIIKEAQH